jgi:signal transduction histidine kinase/AmiR/NasT family two-component response regulator
MEASRTASSSGYADDGEREMSPYELTLAALSYSWQKQAAFNVAVGVSFALVGGPILALGWTLALCVADVTLQGTYRRLSINAHNVDSALGLTWLSWLGLVKGVSWYAIPAGFTILRHSFPGLAFVSIQAVALTALAVSTARNSQRIYLTLVAVPVIALPCCVAATLGIAQGAGALCETLVLAVALWLIGSGTSAVVANWNKANAHRLQAMAEMRLALARSEMAEARLSEALAHAEAASRVKSDFLATMNHEIRTPLNGVLGMAQAMDRGELTGEQRGRLGLITTAGQSLLTLLNDLLDLSKVEAGKVELEDGVVDIEALAQGAAAFLPLLQDKDVSFSVTVEPRAQRYWRGDPHRIRQVLHNLISNAVKFSDRGAVSVRISERESDLVFTVTDTGIGIAPDRLAQVFEPFVQADASTTRRFGGTGLGLTICRDLVNLMGGTIDLVSAEGVGSTFTVTLPLRAAAHPEASVEGDADEPRFADGLRVLVAEDNPMNQVVLRTLLEASGIQPVLVSNGEEAVEAFERGRWDIVLMDIQMPVKDGVAAARSIRAAERGRGADRTPIIALTANAMNHHQAEYLSAGMDAIVAKPINLTVLLETMRAVLETRESALLPLREKVARSAG